MNGRFWAALLAAFMMTTPALSAELTAPDVEAWLNGLMRYGLENGDIAGSVVVVVKDGKVLFHSGKVRVEFDELQISDQQIEELIVKLGYSVYSRKVA